MMPTRVLTDDNRKFWAEQLPALPPHWQAALLTLLQNHYGPQVLDIVNATPKGKRRAV